MIYFIVFNWVIYPWTFIRCIFRLDWKCMNIFFSKLTKENHIFAKVVQHFSKRTNSLKTERNGTSSIWIQTCILKWTLSGRGRVSPAEDPTNYGPTIGTPTSIWSNIGVRPWYYYDISVIFLCLNLWVVLVGRRLRNGILCWAISCRICVPTSIKTRIDISKSTPQ